MDSPDGRDVTRLLEEWRGGNEQAGEELMPLIYAELRRIASGYLSIERPNHTLQPTALVHEAYVRLVNQRQVRWKNRSHFFGIAAQQIRRILVDHARRHRSAKRGGGEKIPLSAVVDLAIERSDQLLVLDRALDRLKALDAIQARVVELRFFGGLTGDETAEVLDCSATTVKRRWLLAKAWLYREMTAD
ncbi:MAG: sigma-70 family RNA polymerase sigma factor [Acidobacteriota bacterium]